MNRGLVLGSNPSASTKLLERNSEAECYYDMVEGEISKFSVPTIWPHGVMVAYHFYIVRAVVRFHLGLQYSWLSGGMVDTRVLKTLGRNARAGSSPASATSSMTMCYKSVEVTSSSYLYYGLVLEWYTGRSQKPLFERTCGFESHRGYFMAP